MYVLVKQASAMVVDSTNSKPPTLAVNYAKQITQNKKGLLLTRSPHRQVPYVVSHL